ncbi:MAG: sigma-70 family RNA polymerase sigma factor [Candidatus Marinimicrobia bacterium]|nr:sigma-70 family RNA polymerase sigma factor [Candidatus Neomarinimicrobiota bacterium]
MSGSAQDELIAACQRGDKRAFEELFLQHYERVYRMGLRYTGNTQEAEDITQDVFVKVLRDLIQFKGGSKFHTWLYRVTLNVCRDKERQRLRYYRQYADTSVDGEGAADGADRDMNLEKVSKNQRWQMDTQELLQYALSQLSPKLRTVIILKHIEELSLLDISGILNCSLGTVSSRLNRGRTRLRDILSKMAVDRTYLQKA